MSIPQLGLRITQPDLKLYIKEPDLGIQTQAPDLTIHTTDPEIIIDLRQSFNSMGLKDIGALAQEVSETSKATILKRIERTAHDGDLLGKAKGPSVTQIAAQSVEPEEKKLEIGLMPAAPPEISVTLGSLKGDYSPGDVAVKLDNGEVKGFFTWGKIEGYLEGESSIDIKV